MLVVVRPELAAHSLYFSRANINPTRELLRDIPLCPERLLPNPHSSLGGLRHGHRRAPVKSDHVNSCMFVDNRFLRNQLHYGLVVAGGQAPRGKPELIT